MSPEEDQFVPRKLVPRNDQSEVLNDVLNEALKKIRARTPARLLAGRCGAAYRTNTQLELREAHAAARDAVRAELRMGADLGEAFVREWNLFEVSSRAANKDEYLLRPDLGRLFDAAARAEVTERCVAGVDFQIVIGDGLSVSAVASQVPRLLPALMQGAQDRGWTLGRIFVVRRCRVGILNEIGELLRPRVAILLIGERPGLATAESLSAYMAYRPQPSDTDANRNLISNIHAQGVRTDAAAERILRLAAAMMESSLSGCQLREEFPGSGPESSRLAGPR